MRSKKGQMFSLDLVLSMVIFIVIFIFVFSLWNLYILRLTESSQTEEMQLIAFQVSEVLFGTEGIPQDWNTDVEDIIVLGLAGKEDGTLDSTKVNAFFELDYNETKEFFNIERFEYYLTIKNLQGETIDTMGNKNSKEGVEQVSVRRFVFIDDYKREVILILWEA